MTEQTTVTIPAVKGKGYASYAQRKADVTVDIAGIAHGYGATLSDAKQSAVSALLELATAQQSAPAANLVENGDGTRIIVVYYPHGTGTDAVNISISSDGTMRRSSMSSMSGTPADNATRHAEADYVTRIF